MSGPATATATAAVSRLVQTTCRRQAHTSSRVGALGKNVFAEFSALATKHNAVNLGQGFPSFPTPDFVKKAAIEAIQANHNQYTRPGGHPEYVTALAQLYSGLMGRQLDPMKEIVTFNGAQEGIAAIMSALLEPGDQVLTFEPYFDAYKTVSTILGMQTVGIPLEMDPAKKELYNSKHLDRNVTFSSRDFHIDLDRLDKTLAANDIKMIVLNTPHNPTGKVFSRQELEQLVQVLQKYPEVLILADEVYEFMCYDDNEHHRIATFPGMFDRVISLFSAGKTFSCTGWRVGYAICSQELAAPILKAHSTIPFCGTTPFEVAMARCFDHAQQTGYFDEIARTLETKRNRLVQVLQEQNWRPIVPEGGYFVCCNVSGLEFFQEFAERAVRDDLPKEEFPDYQFLYKLVQEGGLAAIPTSPFYSRVDSQLSPALVRLAFCKDDETLEQAIETIRRLK